MTTPVNRPVPSIFTNEMFLRAVFGADWERVKVAMFAGDPHPDKAPPGAWSAYPAADMLKLSQTEQEKLNTYFSVGVQSGSSRGLIGFESVRVLVLDDVGTKLDLGQAIDLLATNPNYILETSPGNHQVGWFCDIRDRDWAAGLVKLIYEALGRRGDNLKNLVGYMRLPVGTNGKGHLGPGGFRHRVKAWAPGPPRPSLEWFDVEKRAGRKVIPITAHFGSTAMPDPAEIEADPILQGLRIFGRVIGLGRYMTMGWGFDIECPWSGDHTTGIGGTSYVPVHQRFKCHHGHCQDRNTGDLREWLNQQLREDSGGIVTLAGLEFDEIDTTKLPVPPAPRDWRDRLQRTGKKGEGGPASNLFNVMIALSYAPEFGRAFGLNTFSLREILYKELPGMRPSKNLKIPREWRPADTIELQKWLQQQGLRQVGAGTVDDAVSTMMQRYAHHPVRDWLRALRWDEVPRLDTWLATYLGTPQDQYHACVGRWWLMMMCRRVFEPGCRAEYMPVMEGPQGKEKSSFLAALAGPAEWFSDNLPEIGTKEASEHLVGHWLVEIAEMDKFDRAESAVMKSFLSRTIERYRRAYAKRTQDEPRQCVFVGTVNHRSYLKDETGNRRYWPFAVGTIDIPGLVLVRDQLFAEAWHRAVTEREQYWPDPLFEELFIQPEQDGRLEADPWEHLVNAFLATRKQVMVHEVIVACTGGGSLQLNTTNRNRVTRIMETLRWKRGKKGPKNERFWYPD